MYGKELKREKFKKYKKLLFKVKTPDFLSSDQGTIVLFS